MRKKGFTLAELLIALGIVGIIAALTLPSLMKMRQESAAGPQLSKVKASVEDAAGRILLEDPSTPLKDYDANFAGKLSEHLVMTNAEGGGFRLKDGVVISFATPSGSVSNASGEAFKDVLVDLNGSGKPNADGVDKFRFTLSSQGLLVPQGCAAKLASNNWKASRDYDSATCSSYKLGSSIEDTINDEEDYTPAGNKTCSDGSVIPAYLTCNETDDDDDDDVCVVKTCTGNTTWNQALCDCVAVINTCIPPNCGSRPFDPVNCICLGEPEGCKTSDRIACALKIGYTWDESTCSCNKNEEPDDDCEEKDCGCGTWDSVNCKCIAADTSCSGGQHWDSSICSCVDDEDDEEESCQEESCACGEEWDSSQCKCVAKTGFSRSCTGCDAWDEASCSCKPMDTTCPCGTWDELDCKCKSSSACPGNQVFDDISCTCRPVCEKRTCRELETWDEASCSCKTTKKKCDDGSKVGINESCPTYCCDCRHPFAMGDRCIEGNSTTPNCNKACGAGVGHWEESNDLDMSERGNRTELAPFESYNR